ncbi:response regulator transcription factor [Sulfurovum sp. CS9]|uniref:response regulator transcription factor n=1 Tax=Sulfurovum sp. CS9 TaxID=3391146 RepID=UPI0039E790A9
MSNIKEMTLLYVEDDEELREQFVRVLKPRFKQVYEATDGAQALEKYEQYYPDIMLVDINLPKIDGLEVIERVRKNDKDTPIVVLSAYSDQEKLLKAIKLGLSDYLVKPVPHKKLFALLEEMALKYEDKREESGLIPLQNDYFWKKEEKILSHNDEIITLTKREIILLDFLVEQLNKIVTYEVIEKLIWEDKDDVDHYSSLSHLLKRLRKKLPEELIENIYAEGYRIHAL